MIGRHDTTLYKNAAIDLDNVYVRPQGGVVRREGLQYWDTTTTSQAARIIPFEFNSIQTYLLSFTPGEFKVYRTDVVGTVQATVSSSPISSLTAQIIREMQVVQSADTLLLFHNSLQPIKITRTSHTSWTAASVTFSNIPAYAYSGVTLSNPAGSVTPDVTTGKVVLTGVGTSFDSTFLRQYINMPKGGRIFVTKVTSTTVIEGTITVELANTSSVSSGSWEKEIGYTDVMSGAKGWAGTATFHKGRLWLGNVGSRPQTILASKIGDFFNLDVGEGLDDEAIDITIDDDKVNKINHLFAGRNLMIFTTGGEFSVRSQINDPITPTNVATQLTRETGHGASTVRPISIDGTVVFIESAGSVVRQFVFNDTEASFVAPNISITSQSLVNSPVAMDARGAVSGHPASYVYIVNSDGTCGVLNTLREQELLAWSRFTTDGTFEDVAVSGRKAFFVVKRNIIECLNSDYFMDAAVRSTSGSPTVTWAGFGHLNDEVIRIRGDEFILAAVTPSGGSIDVESAVSTLEGGLFFAAKVKSLPLDLEVAGQSFTGEYKSLQKVLLRLKDSRDLTVTIGGKTTYPPFRQFDDDSLDAPVELFSGWKQIMGGNIDRDVDITVSQEEPLEFELLEMTYTLRV
jgi:hypothetical protein